MKKVKLTFREKVMMFWNLNYRVNHLSKEIHNLKNKHVNCLKSAKKNTNYVSEQRAIELMQGKEYNGCRWCWKEKDTD
jgi:hypothetical protein